MSLKLKITLAALACLLLAIVGTLAVEQSDTLRRLRAQHGVAEREQARQHAMLVEQQLRLHHRALALSAAALREVPLEQPAALRAHFERQPLLRHFFDSVFAAGTDGRLRWRVDAQGGRVPATGIGDRLYFQRALAGEYALEGPVQGRISGHDLVLLAQPIERDGRVVGITGGTLLLDGDELTSVLRHVADGPGGVRVVLASAAGRPIASTDGPGRKAALTDDPLFAEALAALGRRTAPLPVDGLQWPLAAGLVTVAPVAGTDWLVWRHSPWSALTAPVDAARQAAVAAGLLLAVGLSALLAGLLHRLLRPLHLLSRRAARLMDDGDDPAAGWPTGHDEIGRLSRVLRRTAVERGQLDAQNRNVLRQLGSVMSTAPIGLLFTREQRFELVSQHFCQMLGRSQDALVGRPTVALFESPEVYARLGPAVGAAFAAGLPYDGEWQMRHADGTLRWTRLRGQPVDPHDAAAGTIWSVQDITAEVASRAELEWQASHDSLTGLLSRARLMPALDHALAQAASPAGVPSSLLMIDLDRFKPINDTWGHAAGDAMLRGVAMALRESVRGQDVIVRLGGDEFAVLLQHCPPPVALRVAEGVREAIERLAVPWAGRPLRVGASVGVAPASPVAWPTAARWLEAADAAAYAAKASGRNRVVAAQAEACLSS